MRRKSITTKTIHADHWEPHEAVVIRSLNTDDDEQIQDGLAGIDTTGRLVTHGGRMKRLTIQHAIVSWTLTDEHGRPLPLDEASIRSLAQEDSTYIFNEVNALNVPMKEAEKKPSTTPSTLGTEERATSSNSQA